LEDNVISRAIILIIQFQLKKWHNWSSTRLSQNIHHMSWGHSPINTT